MTHTQTETALRERVHQSPAASRSISAGAAPFALRIFLAAVLFPHGAQKLLGWFGGFGFSGTMEYFTGTAGLPWIVGFLVILIEFFGPIALLAGVAVRAWSLAIAGLMLGIMLTNHSAYFFMNWFGNQKAEGMEFFLLAIGMALALLVSGAGNLSIDALLTRRSRTQRAPGGRA